MSTFLCKLFNRIFSLFYGNCVFILFQDRIEYQKFERERMHSRWTKVNFTFEMLKGKSVSKNDLLVIFFGLLGISVFIKTKPAAELSSCQQHQGYHLGLLWCTFCGAKFKEHCVDISRDIVYSVFYHCLVANLMTSSLI